MTLWFVYLVRCSDYSLYCGSTTNTERRVQEHNEGIGSRYTRSRRPVRLVWSIVAGSKSQAYKEELRIKRMKKDAKEAMVAEGSGQSQPA
jgi:putative endonuclease